MKFLKDMRYEILDKRQKIQILTKHLKLCFTLIIIQEKEKEREHG